MSVCLAYLNQVPEGQAEKQVEFQPFSLDQPARSDLVQGSVQHFKFKATDEKLGIRFKLSMLPFLVCTFAI